MGEGSAAGLEGPGAQSHSQVEATQFRSVSTTEKGSDRLAQVFPLRARRPFPGHHSRLPGLAAPSSLVRLRTPTRETLLSQ